MLSLKRYGWLCVLGTEAFYGLCLVYGALLPTRVFDAVSGAQIADIGGARLHHALFELLPGFTWGTASGVIVGAVDLFAFAWIFAWYMVWMHNTSLVKQEK